ncbi:hypothetical protein RYO59_000297 [Thermosynechococcaceae cyanobacterium Okahandja]
MLRAIHPGLLTSLVLIALTGIITTVTAVIGYYLGRDSLRGVSQPVVNPILGNTLSQEGQERPTILDEAEIIARTQALIAEMSDTSTERELVPAPANPAAPEPQAAEQSNLPIVAEDKGVRLEIRSLQSIGSDLVLNVTLKNDSSQGIQFIYTFLEVKDDQGNLLSALTEGLPTDLPAGSDLATGVITIPKSLLADAKTISLRLASYPNQDVQLQAANIPVQGN